MLNKCFRPRRPCVGGARILHYHDLEKAAFPAAAPAASRRGRRQGKQGMGFCWVVAVVQKHGFHRGKLGGDLIRSGLLR